MKKLIAIALIAVMVLSMAACGTVNEAEVSILWSGNGIVEVPNSLINSMERAMYIENIAYAHYGANGDQAAQTKQAQDALNAGCAALVVELVDASAAQEIVDAAKSRNVPVIFFNCAVDEAVISGYDKCVCVDSNAETVGKVQGAMIGKLVVENFDAYDRNADGRISYAVIGGDPCEAAVAEANAALTPAGKSALEAVAAESIDAVVGSFTEESAPVELFITSSDADALELLAALQSKDYNSTRLTTHNIPIFTVGSETDASAFTNTSNMTEEEKAALIFNVTNVIGNGQMTGTAVADLDSMAITVAAVLRNMLKGNDTFQDVAAEYVTGSTVKIPYTTVS